MYEVFIDNKKILFIDSTQNLNNLNNAALFSDFLNFKNYDDFVKSLPSSEIVFVVCKNQEKAWRNFLNNFEIIEAAGGVVTCNDSFLAIFRNEKWDLPKGKLEANEDPILGAIREIQEECGITDLKFINPIYNTFHTYEYKGISILKKTYWYHFSISRSQNLTPQIEEGITQASWLKNNNKQDFLENTYNSIKEVLTKFENLTY